jgi:hypothetical protein
MIVVLRYSVFTLVQTFIHVIQNAVDVAPVAVVVVKKHVAVVGEENFTAKK